MKPDVTKFIEKMDKILDECGIDNHAILVHSINLYIAVKYPSVPFNPVTKK